MTYPDDVVERVEAVSAGLDRLAQLHAEQAELHERLEEIVARLARLTVRSDHG